MNWIFDDKYKYWSLRHGSIELVLQQRPWYCDRGHWDGKVFGIGSIDGQDGFPRYFMDFERAKLELEEWLKWRLSREKHDVDSHKTAR